MKSFYKFKDVKSIMKLYLILIIIILFFGCLSQQDKNNEKSEWQVKYEESQKQYGQLLDRYKQIVSNYEDLNQSYEDLSNSYYNTNLLNNKLSSDYNNLNSAYNKSLKFYKDLNSSYNNLNSSYNNLKSLYDNLAISYSRLNDNYRNLQSQTGRLPKDIIGSPSIPGLDFLLTKDLLILKHTGLNLSSVTDTKSMNPTITASHTAIFTTNFDAENLKVGNIVAYKSTSFELPIMHRIIDIRRDSSGTCYIIQGDNNPSPDSECVRPSQVIGLVVGVIFNTNAQGYRYCPGDVIATAKNNTFFCIPNNIPAGVYVNNQTITSETLIGFPLCSEKQNDKPYTVVTPDKKVYCYETVN